MHLKRWIEANEESGRAFARRAGVPRHTVHRLVHGDGGVTVANAARIVIATGGGVSFADLVSDPQVARQLRRCRQGAA